MTTNQTNFQKVKEFNIAFGISRYDQENPNVFKENPNLVKLRFDLIQEETDELKDAYLKKEIVEVIDALADIEYVIHGCADSFGVNLDNYIKNEMNEREKLMKNLRTTNPPKLNLVNFLNQINNKIKIESLDDSFVYLLGKHQEIVNCLEFNFKTHNFQESVNLLVKLYNSVTQMSSILGFDIDYIFDKVHQSNMSKLCSSQEEADKSLEKYQNDSENRYDSPTIRQSPLKGKYVIYNKSTGKALKSYLYRPVTDDIIKYIEINTSLSSNLSSGLY